MTPPQAQSTALVGLLARYHIFTSLDWLFNRQKRAESAKRCIVLIFLASVAYGTVGRSRSDCADWRTIHPRDGARTARRRNRIDAGMRPSVLAGFSVGWQSACRMRRASAPLCATPRVRARSSSSPCLLEARPGERVEPRIIDYGFSTLGAEALFAGHHPANEASPQLLLELALFVRTRSCIRLRRLMHLSYLLRKT